MREGLFRFTDDRRNRLAQKIPGDVRLRQRISGPNTPSSVADRRWARKGRTVA